MSVCKVDGSYISQSVFKYNNFENLRTMADPSYNDIERRVNVLETKISHF